MSAYSQEVTERDSESFHLPEWGTEGAPEAPEPDKSHPDDDEGPSVFVEVRPELIRSTIPLPDSHRLTAVIGLLTVDGAAVIGELDLRGAVAAARSAALDRLCSEAEAVDATAIVGIRLSTISRLNDVVVTAYGTAVKTQPS